MIQGKKNQLSTLDISRPKSREIKAETVTTISVIHEKQKHEQIKLMMQHKRKLHN